MNTQESFLNELIQPETEEADATQVIDVYGLKSKAADDMAGAHSTLAALGMVPGVGNAADAISTMLHLQKGDTKGALGSAVSMIPFLGLLSGGLKAVKGGKKALTSAEKLKDFEQNVRKTGPRMSEKMPRTSPYDFPNKNEPWTPTGKSHKSYLPYETKSEKLFMDLSEGDLDMVDFQNKLSELERIDPEKAMWIIEEFGHGGF